MLELKDYYNIKAEQAVLGTIILNNEYLSRVEDILLAKHFYEEAHSSIYQRILTIKEEGSLADQVTLQQFFESDNEIKKIGGWLYIRSLLASSSTIVSIRDYAFLIIENYNKRRTQSINVECLERLEKESSLKVADYAVNELALLDDEVSQAVILTSVDMLDGLIENWARKESLEAISSGLSELDKMLNGGFYKKKLYVIGAAPGCGKTSFSQQIILKGLEKKKGCFFFSMEMERENVLTRFLGHLSGINPFRILINKIYPYEQEQFDKSCLKWTELQESFLMTDETNISVNKVKSILKRAKRKIPISLVVLDYIQIMQLRESKNSNEATLIKENITALKDIAKTFDVAVIALSQITKDSLGNRPGLKALKGSGGIGEGADTVINMWSDESEEDDKKAIKTLNLEIAKNRNGAKGVLAIDFDGEFGRFTEKQTKEFNPF